MTEAQVAFLYNIAATISRSQNVVNKTLLKSYYLMRCKDITRGYGLPDKYFSPKIRCPNCCVEWNNSTGIKMRSIKLSKRQKRRLRSKEVSNSNNQTVRCRKDLLISNELEQICAFCKNSTITTVLKPQTQLQPTSVKETSKIEYEENNKAIEVQNVSKKMKNKDNKRALSNVYSNAFDIFSLQNKNNTLASTIKEKPKVINNNKKKKDRYAGLCQKAVLASAKLKEHKDKSNALNLFLKPST